MRPIRIEATARTHPGGAEGSPDAVRSSTELAHRARIGLWLIIGSNLLFALTDLRLAGAVLGPVYILKLLQIGVTAVGLWVLRRPRTLAVVLDVVLATATSICMLVALSGALTNDIITTTILCIAFAWGTATLLPLGVRHQSAVAVMSGLAMLTNVYLVRGDLSVAIGYPTVAVVIALGTSVCLAYEFARHRTALARASRGRDRAEDDLRQAHDALGERVRERTAELEAANQQLQASTHALQAGERFVSAVLETVGALIGVVDREGRIVQFNRACEQTFGYSGDEVRGRCFWDLLPSAAEIEPARIVFQRLLVGEWPSTYDTYWFTRSGERRWLAWSTTFLTDDAGAIEYVIGTGIDITERRNADKARRRSEEHWRALIEQATDLIGVLDADMTIRYLSPSIVRLLGYRPDDWLGRTALELIHPEDIATVAEALQRGLEHHDSGAWLLFRIRHRDGSWRVFEGTDTNLLENDAVRGVVVNLHDITEQRVAEAALQQLNIELEQRVRERTAQLEAVNHELESFSYSVSHDLQAPLRRLRGFADALSEDYGAQLEPRGRGYVERLRGAGQRMEELITDLLGLCRVTSGALHIARVDLGALAGEVLAELRRSNPEREVNCVVAPRLLVDADPRLLRVALENLLGNAWKYTSKHPHARIEVGLQADQDPPVYFVRDDGAGFDIGYAERLFAPFQRLHPSTDFEGTGIGLATVQRIVRRHGGRIWAKAAVEHGATFYFTLAPAVAAADVTDQTARVGSLSAPSVAATPLSV